MSHPPRLLGLGTPRAVRAAAIAASDVAPSARVKPMTGAMSAALRWALAVMTLAAARLAAKACSRVPGRT